MEPAYPFDPNDWTTITPLFEALIKAPASHHDFTVWLAQWNDLDIAVYDAWTHLKRRAYYDTTDLAAERDYQRFTREIFSTYHELTMTLAAQALARQPDPPLPSYRQLWRRWQNQITLFRPESLELQAEISELESSYRELTRRIECLPGNPISHWMEQRTVLNDLMLKLLQLRRQLAYASGLPTSLAYRWCELNRFDYSIETCQSFHCVVEEVVVPVVMQLRSSNLPRRRPPKVIDPATLIMGVEQMLTSVDPTFGKIFRTMRDGHLDLDPRPGKANTNEQWFFPCAGRPYLHIASTNPATLLHECGHAMHEYLSFQSQRSLWNFSGPEEFQEFAATSMELLCWPYYEQANGGFYTASESAVARHNVLQFYLEALASNVMEDAFEHWLYGEAPEHVRPSDLDATWLAFKQRFTPWDKTAASEQEAMTGWQRRNWSLFRIPLYTITYPIAIIGACQLGRQVQIDRTRVVDNYKAALTRGNTESLPELFRVAGVTFPFTQQAVEEAVQFVFDQGLKIPHA